MIDLNWNLIRITVTCIVLFGFVGCEDSDSLIVYDLLCENLQEPLGVDTYQPRFSWKNKSIKTGAAQTAYQLVAASDLNRLDESNCDLWNSGKIESASSILIPYDGIKLHSGQLLYWKVRTWDEEGDVSPWSRPSRLGIGLIEEDSWTASYIGFPSVGGFQSCPQLRKSFSISEAKRGEIYLIHINSLGYHEAYMNGEKVNDHVLSPAVSQFDKRSLSVTYDVTPFIREGENDLVFWLGSGWFSRGLPGVIGNGPLIRAQLEKVSGNSREIISLTDESWQGRESEYTRLGDWMSGQYGGERIVGNLEKRSVAFSSPEDLDWEKVAVVSVPEHEVTPQMVEPNRIEEVILPSKISQIGPDVYIVDMGRNLTGWLKIEFSELAEGQEIILEYCDHLDNKQEFVNQNQEDRYIASGFGKEIFMNKFNYHGFRYVRISNLERAPQANLIEAYLIHTDFVVNSTFECSDPELNQIHDMVFYTLKCLSLGGYLVDCPQLERLGYGGDGNASTITAQTMFSLAPLYRNWLQAWADVIREDGSMPHTAPNPYAAGGGPYWCGFIISASWNTYQNYGDKRILEEYYPAMIKWLEYVDRHTLDGLLRRWPDTSYRAWYLGDWAVPDGVDQTDTLSIDLVSNCYIALCYDRMHKIANLLGQTDDAEYFSERKSQLAAGIHQNFFNKDNEFYGTGSQIDQVFPLLAGVVPSALVDSVTTNLIRRTETKYNGHLATGLVGVPVIMEWAQVSDHPEFIYSMLKKKSYPGYLYMLERGATTTWEHWNGQRSRIHNCYNGVGQWFYQIIGGVRTIMGKEAYREFLIDPQIPQGITWAKTKIESPRGSIVVDWKLEGNQMNMEIDIPVGTIGKLYQRKNTSNLWINGEENTVHADTVQLFSGSYSIRYNY